MFVIASLIQPSTARAADRTQVATSALEFGGTLGKLLWDTVDTRGRVTDQEASQYRKLAVAVNDQISRGRISSSLLAQNFNIVGTSLLYAAVVDPEPLSKAVAGFAAWGAKKTGDALGQMVVDQSQKQARSILAQGLKNDHLSASQLKNMSPMQLSARVADFKIGGQTLRQILRDDPGSLSMLQAQATDLATDIGVTALAMAKGTAEDVKTIQRELAKTTNEVAAYQKEVKGHLEKVESRLSGLETATRVAHQKFVALESEVRDHAKATRTIAQISYSGWSTAQKLQAVSGGLFPDLTPRQRDALVDSLKAEEAREATIAGIQRASEDFGKLREIASNLGLPKNIVKGLGDAQKVATGIAQFARGDYLGAISTITSLVGPSAPDAAAERHVAMMKYLDEQFAGLNKKLDDIIKAQVETIKAIDALAKEQRTFRLEVLGQLDRIEDTVLKEETILRAIQRNQWTECDALLSGTTLNNQYDIPTRQTLIGVVTNPNTPKNAAACYSRMIGFLEARVKTATWSGEVIDARNFPAATIPSAPEIQRALAAFQSQHDNAYKSARDFVLLDRTDASASPAPYIARLAHPVVNANIAMELISVLAKKEIQDRLRLFKCNQTDVLAPALRDLLCVGRPDPDRNTAAPLPGRWRDLLDAPLIGPWSTRLIDMGITLSTIADFAERNDISGTFTFVNAAAIEGFSTTGPTADLRRALQQRKGLRLLEELRWLTEAGLLQQGIAYGDYTAQLIEKALYDEPTRSLKLEPTSVLKQQALSAMRTNPVLARNVILLAMRHAISDSTGGPEKASSLNYRQTYYALALLDFAGPQACSGSTGANQKLADLFPNWRFEYRVTREQHQEKRYDSCPLEFEPDAKSPTPPPLLGSGVVASFGDFYVMMPSPLGLAEGTFEQPESLLRALADRDRLSQAIIDRTVDRTIKSISGQGIQSKATAARIAFALLNEGWGWEVRPISK